MRHSLTPIAVIVACSVLGGCAPPPSTGLFQTTVMTVTKNEAEAAKPFVELADRATLTLDIALPEAKDTTITDAIIRAHERGVAVRAMTDIDMAADQGFQDLQAAGVPLRLADGGLAYFDFSINADVAWTSEETHMTHASAQADRKWAVVASHVGSTAAGTRVVFDMRGEDLAYDLFGELNQVFGGVDATSTTAFSAQAKSITDDRYAYQGDSDVVYEVWFAPQERPTKRMIDAVYSARSSVRIITNDFANDGFARALQEKAATGFDVEIIVGEAFRSSSSVLSRELTERTPDVVKRQVTGSPVLPTMVLVDMEPLNGSYAKLNPRVFVLSHDLWSSSRLYKGKEVVNDQLVDGTMVVLADSSGAPSAELIALKAVYDGYRASSGAL